jgi:transposase
VDPLAPVRELAARVAELTAENAKLRAERDAAMALVAQLAARVEELERALGSGRGGGGNKPPPRRPSSGKPRGGQKGHSSTAPAAPGTVDETREHRLHDCPRCAGPVSPVDDPNDRFEYEAVARALRTVRHVLHAAWCPRCRRKVRAKAPLALPGCSYGPHAHATLATLRATTGATVGDLENFARDVWRRPLSGGQVVAMIDRCGAALAPTFWWIVEELTREPSINQDSTSWRFDGARAVMWVFTSRRLTAYWIDSEGTQLVPRRVLGERVEGYVGSDGAERFQLVANAGEQRCLAHTLREARELLASRAESEEVVRMMSELRDRAARLIGYHKRRGELATSTWLQYLSRERAGLRRLSQRDWTDADCVRLAKRIGRDLDGWLLFMTTPPESEVEPTNNRAERGLRPAVIDRRRMQQNRDLRGVYRDVVTRTVATTCKQLGVNVQDVIVEALAAHARAGPEGAPPSEILMKALAEARAHAKAMRSTYAPAAMPR